MASDEQLQLVRQGREAWHTWRNSHPEVAVDFAGADFTSDEFKRISFAGFNMGNRADFRGARFGNEISFHGIGFSGHADFRGATFEGTADFDGVEFRAWANFVGATFCSSADFSGVTFRGEALFGEVIFKTDANFIRTAFNTDAQFSNAKFGGEASFEEASFTRMAMFGGARFMGKASFANTAFVGNASFNGAIFSESVSLAARAPKGELARYFKGIDFSAARFLAPADFAARDFVGESIFATAYFSEPPDFRATEHRENLDWTGVKFGFGGRLGKGLLSIRTPGWTTQTKTITDLRRLRGIAKEIHAVDAERDLFILERQAERGLLWKDWWRGGWATRLVDWWRPLTSTVVMGFYIYLSNCGRSIWRPLFWLVVLNWAFYYLYAALYEALFQRPLFAWVKNALFDLTLASAIPFGATARPSFESAVRTLFQDSQSGLIQIPWQYQAVSATQGITNLVLLFLLALALRNYFKFR